MPNLPFSCPNTGKNVSLVALKGATIGADCTYTLGSAFDILASGAFDSWTYSGQPVHEMIKPANLTMANHVLLYDDFTIDIGEIIPEGGNSKIMSVFGSFNIIRVEAKVIRPSSAEIYTFAALCSRGPITVPLVEGKQVATLQLLAAGLAPYWGNGTPPF